jgi:hypothetical protein
MSRIKAIASAVFSFFERWEKRRNERSASPEIAARRRGSTFGRHGF